ncbi:MAG TPA: ribbon-helix-helix protein, CopG family [Methanocorpusculum sp.]|jgi:hypothetical protein|nr:ribbon-helix-helix protein, CopG family [Methanocorpusculum sp.]
MNNKHFDKKTRLSCSISLAVTADELEAVNRCCERLGLSRTDLVRTSIEAFVGTKIFRERTCEK